MDPKKRRDAISPVDLYRETARTNCGECGFPTCLAFATDVIVYRGDMKRCPYLSQRALNELAPKISQQQERGIYVQKQKEDIARQVAEGLLDLDFREAAARVGGRFLEDQEEEAVELIFLGEPHVIKRSGEVLHESAGDPEPYEKILLYNHLLRSKGTNPTGRWITIEALPGALTKAPELEEVLEARLGQAYADLGREAFVQACLKAGGTPSSEGGDATVAVSFAGFPKVPLLILVWEASEDFPARARLLMDESIRDHLDPDSLLVLAEYLGNKILAQAPNLK